MNDTKNCFPQTRIDTWNELKEVIHLARPLIMAKNVHQLKEKLDKYRYRDRTIGVKLRPYR